MYLLKMLINLWDNNIFYHGDIFMEGINKDNYWACVMNLYLKMWKQEITLLPSQAKALQTAIKATKLLIYVMFYLLNNLTLEKFYKLIKK